MPWLTVGIPAAASLAGDAMSASSAGQTNRTQEQLAYNAAQFNASQAAQQDQFQRQMQHQAEVYNTEAMTKAEQYDTQMSDTAMQRRKADLEAAGFNPLLAIGAGGASAPTINAPTAPMGSGASASMNPAQIQNPGQAFGNLGNQISSAMSNANLSAQKDLLVAQKNKTVSETPSGTDDPFGAGISVGTNHALGDATIANIKANTDLQGAQKIQVARSADQIVHMMNNTDADTMGKIVSNMMAGQNYDILVATKDAIIKEGIAQGKIADVAGNVGGGTWGTAIAVINQLLGVGTSAAKIATPLGRAMR